MEILPNEIEAIIHAYRIEFERVEDEIHHALNRYYDIENRVSDLVKLIEGMNLTDHYGKNLKIMLSDVSVECKKIMSGIIEEQTITPVQKLMLNNLSEQIEYNHVFQILFHPLCSFNLF